MPKPSHREKLLEAGFDVVLERGYCGASVRDIVSAADVPQGSFTNHFASKDAFCLELLNRYLAASRIQIELSRPVIANLLLLGEKATQTWLDQAPQRE
jgi:TetR/AcrR family transcriptional repressor of nem operon